MPIPNDDLNRTLIKAITDSPSQPHLGIVGDTYTVLLTGHHTAGKFCLIDMHVPPGGGPPPHRHDFEETFILLEGQIEAIFRGQKSTVKAGETIHIPANAPHQFRNNSQQNVRMLCICAPAGQEEFFASIGIPLPTSTTPPPPPDEATEKAFREKAQSLAEKYKTEFLKQA